MMSTLNHALATVSSQAAVVLGESTLSTSAQRVDPTCTWSVDTLTPSSQRVLILAPHPDDESLGCGGTASLLSRAGVPVDVAFMTRGELGGKPGFKVSEVDQLVLQNQRAQEGLAACRTLGVERVYFLSGHDGQVDQQPGLSEEIFALLATGEYSTVFGPWPFDAHKDHCATFDWLVAALARCETNLEIWLYEVWSTLHPNRLVRIDAVMETKQQAIRAHCSQLHNYDYLDGFLALSQYRGFLLPGSRHAEAFFVCDREEIFRFRESRSYAERECFVHRQMKPSPASSSASADVNWYKALEAVQS